MYTSQALNSQMGCATARLPFLLEEKKEEVYIGGREVFGVYLKQFVPRRFSRIIRKVAVR